MHEVTHGVSIHNVGTILSPARLHCSQAINSPKEIKNKCAISAILCVVCKYWKGGQSTHF